MIYQLGWTTLPGLRGLSCSDFRAALTDAPDTNRGVAMTNVRSATGNFEYDDLVENVKTLSVDYGDFHGIGQSSGGFVSIEHISSVTSAGSVASEMLSVEKA